MPAQPGTQQVHVVFLLFKWEHKRNKLLFGWVFLYNPVILLVFLKDTVGTRLMLPGMSHCMNPVCHHPSRLLWLGLAWSSWHRLTGSSLG